MRDFVLTFENAQIPFSFGYQCIDEIAARVLALEPDRIVVVTDRIVNDLYGHELARRLGMGAETLTLAIDPGEADKQLVTVGSFAEQAIRWGITRASVIVALGGGVTGNLGGLLAGLMFRGIRLVHVPTTLIGVSDSVVSLKQAVNSSLGKNHLGTYYEPTAVVADLKMLETLPLREVRSGMCECIKNALAIRPEFIDELRSVLRTDGAYEPDDYEMIVLEAIESKQRVMRNDKCERNAALVLEYGHTVGHAIELASHAHSTDPLPHGEAVALGMLYAAAIARERGMLSVQDEEVHHELIVRAGVVPRFPPGLEWAQVRHMLAFDNKRGYRTSESGEISMVLLEGLGSPAGPDERPLVQVPLEAVDRAHTRLVAEAFR